MGKLKSCGVAWIIALLVFWPIARADSAPDQANRLAEIAKTIEAQRTKLHIPGVSVAIVKDDKVIFARGFGLRDVEKELAVTPDTLFAIGSCSKAFTAMACAMAADEGKLSFDDSPKKFVPDFKLKDPDADAKVTIRDLLCHRSGLSGTDLAWYTGTLTRDEVIRAAAFAEPTAQLGQKWQYQNVMYSAAGQCMAKALGSTWEDVIDQRFFEPLRMVHSDTSVRRMQKSKDYSLGYDIEIDEDAHKPFLLPTRDLTNIAPAGAINSSAGDMAQWLRFLLAGGEYDGKRLVSKKNFDECLKKQISMGGNTGYSFGWATLTAHGQDVLAHSGGIDGFNSHVAFMPSRNVGVVILTNVSGSPIAASVSEAVWRHFAGFDEPAPPSTNPSEPRADPSQETGSYRFAQAGISIEVKIDDGKLVAIVPGQPTYTLVSVGGRKYRLDGAPDGFFMTFRAVKDHPDQAEMYLEQPQGNYVLPRESADAKAKAAREVAKYDGPNKDLIGEYEGRGLKISITVEDGKVVAIVPGQPVYTLTPIEGTKDAFKLPPAPDEFEIHVKRDGDEVKELFIKQPQGDMTVKRVAASRKPTRSADDILARVIQAMGGEANVRKHKSAMTTAQINFASQGVTAEQTVAARAPFASARHTEFRALDRTIGTLDEIYDGETGVTRGSFLSPRPMGRRAAAEARIESAFHGPLRWKELFDSIEVAGSETIEGEPCTVLELKPARGTPVRVWVSDKTGRILCRNMTKTSDGDGNAVKEVYSDFREVDGVVLPFKIIQTTDAQDLAQTIVTLQEVTFDVDLPDEKFNAR